MPIRDLMEYDLPEEFSLEKEEDIIKLLRSVRKGINNLEYTFKTNELKKVLNVIKSGEHIIKSTTKDIKVDLSAANNILEKYKFNSEGGCRSCKYIERFKQREETFSYCRLSEKSSDVNERKGFSKMIEKYSETGCDEKVPKFRPIEEVLIGVDF